MTVQAVFLGTPAAAIPALEALNGVADVRLVVTRPDRPRGRSKRLRPSPVSLAAVDLGLPLRRPATKAELHDDLMAVAPFDVGVVVAYGMIILGETLELAEHGFLNLHFSLLPRWRGAAPVQRAIYERDAMTGVSLMKMDEGLDTGGVISQVEENIAEDDTTDSLTARLATAGAALLTQSLPGYLAESLRVRPQSSTGVTYAAKVLPEEARLDFAADHAEVLAAIRAFNPKPGAFGRLGDERLKIWEARVGSGHELLPGELRFIDDELLVGTAGQALSLTEVQPSGKRRMSGPEWARGRRGELGRLR